MSPRRPSTERACLDCHRPSTDSRCPACKRVNAARRKAQGLTSERGSTWSGRKIRRRVLDKTRDKDGIPRCFYCAFGPATISDHYIPLAHGGADTEGNQVAACGPCNSTKGDQMPGDFLTSSWLARRRADVARSASTS